MKQYLLLMFSQSLIGTGFFFLYVNHVRSIFESRTNIAHLTQLERETLLRQEDALYYSFYKIIIAENNFWSGYDKLKNVTTIEYPNSVNVLQRFHVLPELTIAYIYHSIRYYASTSRLLDCWRLNEPQLQFELHRCDHTEQSMQFYLEFVWVMGGVTILIIYAYGSFLSENIFGGIYAVVSYIMFHSYASKIYERPVARENFAFPIIFLQMFYLCLCMDRRINRKHYIVRLIMIGKLTILTAIALLCWQLSSIIFAMQILIMTSFMSMPSYMMKTFYTDYSLSQILAILVAYYLSGGNKNYIFGWQNGPAFGLLLSTIIWRIKPESSNNECSMKTMVLGFLMASVIQASLLDALKKIGITRTIDNAFALYGDLIVHWSLQSKVNFNTSLAACKQEYSNMKLSELWELLKTLVVKPYCMYGVVMLAKFFRKWRKSTEKKTPNDENIERAKNYVLEDFLEENHISMKDMTNLETEKDLNECLQLLKDCDYNYDRYKTEKAKLKKDNKEEHNEFINDIKKLKEEINEINEKKNKDREKENEKKTNDETQSPEEKSPPDVKTKPSKNEDKNNEVNGNRRVRSTKSKSKRTTSSSTSSAGDTNNSSCPSSNTTIGKAIKAEIDIFIFSFTQLAAFILVGLTIKSLFFLSFTLGCAILPTIPSKFWYKKQRDLLWTVLLAVFMTSLVDPGMVNIREEYFPKQYSYGSDDLDTMCEWIKMNTEKDAVFAGPIEIIGTVHLTTKRPIVNHAHLEMRQISDRTEYVYSIFSRQQSSDIYNQCSQLKIQYLIITLKECSNTINDDCDLLAIWDDMQPAYRKYPQFCSELVNKNIPSFLKVFSNDYYGIIKMFSQSVQINLKYSKMPEKIM